MAGRTTRHRSCFSGESAGPGRVSARGALGTRARRQSREGSGCGSTHSGDGAGRGRGHAGPSGPIGAYLPSWKGGCRTVPASFVQLGRLRQMPAQKLSTAKEVVGLQAAGPRTLPAV